jgi:threonine 3-dehydrogenase
MGTSMKALVKAGPEQGLKLLNVQHPSIGDKEVLIKVTKTAICGTDLHIWNWDEWSQRTIPTPMTTGHEFVGHVAEIGSRVKGIAVGDRVTGEGHITCGYCRNCKAGRRHLCRNTIGLGVNRPGCFAEYVQLPASNVFPVPKAVPDDIAAFMDPLGNAVHSALSWDLVGEDVLITGAGPIGMMCAAICKQVGARYVVVTDVNEYRLNIARHCGADVAINVRDNGVEAIQKAMSHLGMKEGFDVGLEMSGSEYAMRSMLATMNHGGNISMLGIPSGPFAIDWDKIIFKGLTVKGIYGREMFETWYKMSNLLTSGLTERIRPVVTHVIAADEFARGFKACAGSQSGKVVLDWE